MQSHAKPTLSIAGSNSSCDGAVTLILNGAHSGSTITWYEGSNTVGFGVNLNLTNVSNGSHTYKAVVKAPVDKGGCEYEITFEVAVDKIPDFTIVPSMLMRRWRSYFVPSSSVSTGYTYQWLDGSDGELASQLLILYQQVVPEQQHIN